MPIRSIAPLALVLVVLFATVVAGALFPLQPLDPLWQWRLTTVLLNSAPLPLLALALLQFAVVLDPADTILHRRHRTFAQLAVAAAIGFLLLLPLQVSAGLRQQTSLGNAQLSRINAAERRLAALRQTTAEASSNADLSRRFRSLQGPLLSPADLANPTPVLKAQLRTLFERAQIQIARERASLPPAGTSAALPDMLRNGIACLALAAGYAAFAYRRGSELTLLQEGQDILERLNLRRQFNRRSSQSQLSDEDYLRQIRGEEEP